MYEGYRELDLSLGILPILLYPTLQSITRLPNPFLYHIVAAAADSKIPAVKSFGVAQTNKTHLVPVVLYVEPLPILYRKRPH